MERLCLKSAARVEETITKKRKKQVSLWLQGIKTIRSGPSPGKGPGWGLSEGKVHVVLQPPYFLHRAVVSIK
jgi:hypothetical protein